MTRSQTPPQPRLLVDRRTVLGRLAALGLVVSPVAGLLNACGSGDGRQPGTGDRDTSGGMPDWTMGGDTTGLGMMDRGMMGGEMLTDMRVIHDLLVGHAKIRRQVDDIDGGIQSRTTSDDPRLAELIRAHVQAMRGRVEANRPIRLMDPVFREIFEHHAAISIDITELPGGVRVTETSGDPQVRLLIRQHAHRAVSEFVAAGMQQAMRPTPLPDGYRG